jgi:hypothetical protein
MSRSKSKLFVASTKTATRGRSVVAVPDEAEDLVMELRNCGDAGVLDNMAQLPSLGVLSDEKS